MDTHRGANVRAIDFQRPSSASPERDDLPSISFASIAGFQCIFDALCVAAIGAATAQWIRPAPLYSPNSVVLLVAFATIIMMNSAHLLGAYHQKMLSSLIASIGTALVVWAAVIGVALYN